MKQLEIPPFPFAVDHSLPIIAKPTSTIDSARGVIAGDSNEPLIDVRSLLIPTDVLYQSEKKLIRKPHRVLLRESVARRLLNAHKSLNKFGFGIIVLDAHRTLDFQKSLVDFYTTPELGEGFVSPVSDSESLVPPHHTGSAVDLTLIHNGRRLALGTAYDSFDEAAAPEAMESANADPQARHLRRLLANALTDEGFVPHYLEWWHWSYGDQYWAAENNLPKAIYGPAVL